MPNEQENQPQPDSQPNEQPNQPMSEPTVETRPAEAPVAETPAETVEALVEATPAEPVAEPVAEPTTPSPFTAPEPSATPAPTPTMGGNPFKKFSPPVLIGIIVAAAIVLLGGGGAAAYFLYYQNPDKVVFDSLSGALTAETATFTSEINYKSDEAGKYKITVDGKSDGIQSDITIGAQVDSQDNTFSVDGGFITSEDGDVYLKVNDIQKLLDQFLGASTSSALTTYYGDVIKEIDGKWLKISSEDLKSVSEDYSKQQTCLTDLSKEFSKDNSMKKEVENLFNKNRFIKVTKSLGSKDVKGTASLGYELQFDSDKAYEFFKGMADTKLGKALKDCDDTYDFSNVKKSDFDDTSDATTTVEIWASRFGHQLTEVSISATEKDQSVNILFNPKFNVPVTVETPKDATSIKKVYQDYMDATNSLQGSYSSYYDDYYNYSY